LKTLKVQVRKNFFIYLHNLALLHIQVPSFAQQGLVQSLIH